jgi:hypothetical protein
VRRSTRDVYRSALDEPQREHRDVVAQRAVRLLLGQGDRPARDRGRPVPERRLQRRGQRVRRERPVDAGLGDAVGVEDDRVAGGEVEPA